MVNITKTKTTDQETIKNWIESRGGRPARLAYDSTSIENDPLAVWFDDAKKDVPQSYQGLDWDEFFSIMDHYKIAFEYEENASKEDRHYRFVKR